MRDFDVCVFLRNEIQDMGEESRGFDASVILDFDDLML